MMRAVIILMITLWSGSVLGAAPGAFTGFWKEDCKDAFGLQIMPFGGKGRYSVSFCGPGGCFEPGTYRPLTTIEHDSEYKVISSDHIKVVGKGGVSDYHKCSEDTNPTLKYKSTLDKLIEKFFGEKT